MSATGRLRCTRGDLRIVRRDDLDAGRRCRLLATNASAPHIVAGAIGIAVAATIGMGAGQYLSDEQRNVCKAMVMALATLTGSVLPAIPFAFGTSTACVVASLAITLLAGAVIGHYRGYVVTYTILIVVSILTVGLPISVG